MLHFRKGDATVDIPLYSTTGERAGAANHLGVREGGATKYADLAPREGQAASDLAIRVLGVTNYLMKYPSSICGGMFEDGSGNAYFFTIANDGTIVTSATNIFSVTNYAYIYTGRLSNNNYVVVYRNGSTFAGYFRIIDVDGNSVKGETLFESGDVYPSVGYAIAGLSDDKFVIAYSDFSVDKARFIIYDNDGTVSTSKTDFDSNTGYLDAAASGTLWAVAYEKSGSIYYAIWNSSGVEQLSSTLVSSGDDDVFVTFLSNGNIAICYEDFGRGKGYFKIMDQVGNTVVSETEVAAVSFLSIDSFDSGSFIIAYEDTTDKGYLSIYNNAGSEVVTDKLYYASVGKPGVTCSGVDVAFITFYADDDADKPKCVLFDPNGDQIGSVITLSSVYSSISGGGASASMP